MYGVPGTPRMYGVPGTPPELPGTQSLIEQPIVMSYHGHTPEQRQAVGIPDNMIRLSCGIENSEDLIADLRQAFGSAS